MAETVRTGDDSSMIHLSDIVLFGCGFAHPVYPIWLIYFALELQKGATGYISEITLLL